MAAIPVPPAVKKRFQRPVTPVMPVKGGGRLNRGLGLQKQGRPLPNPGGPGSVKAGPTPIKNGFDMNKIRAGAANRVARDNPALARGIARGYNNPSQRVGKPTPPGLVDKFTNKYKRYGK
jgi:hypothetical protein